MINELFDKFFYTRLKKCAECIKLLFYINDCVRVKCRWGGGEKDTRQSDLVWPSPDLPRLDWYMPANIKPVSVFFIIIVFMCWFSYMNMLCVGTLKYYFILKVNFTIAASSQGSAYFVVSRRSWQNIYIQRSTNLTFGTYICWHS